MQSEADHDSSVKVENRRGQWVPAIPLPFFGLRRACWCGAKFWTRAGYEGHYSLVHILALDRVSPLLEVSWPCGDCSYGRGRAFRLRAIGDRLRWHWLHRAEGGVTFPPGQSWSPGQLSEKRLPREVH